MFSKLTLLHAGLHWERKEMNGRTKIKQCLVLEMLDTVKVCKFPLFATGVNGICHWCFHCRQMFSALFWMRFCLKLYRQNLYEIWGVLGGTRKLAYLIPRTGVLSVIQHTMHFDRYSIHAWVYGEIHLKKSLVSFYFDCAALRTSWKYWRGNVDTPRSTLSQMFFCFLSESRRELVLYS